MNVTELTAALEGFAYNDTEPAVAEHDDGVMYEVLSVRQEHGATILVLGEVWDDCATGSYGGEDAEAPQDRRQRTIADRAGLSDLHRPQTGQRGSEAGCYG